MPQSPSKGLQVINCLRNNDQTLAKHPSTNRLHKRPRDLAILDYFNGKNLLLKKQAR
jgi:hypothetical protein